MIDERGIWNRIEEHALCVHEAAYVHAVGPKDCMRCDGKGDVKKSMYHNEKVWTNCKKCGGSGKLSAAERIVYTFKHGDYKLEVSVLSSLPKNHSDAWKDTR